MRLADSMKAIEVIALGTCAYAYANFPRLRESIAKGVGLLVIGKLAKRLSKSVERLPVKQGLIMINIPILGYAGRMFSKIAEEVASSDNGIITSTASLILYGVYVSARLCSATSYYTCMLSTVLTLTVNHGMEYLDSYITAHVAHVMSMVVDAVRRNQGIRADGQNSGMTLVAIQQIAPLRCAGLNNANTAEGISLPTTCAVCMDDYVPKTLSRTLPCEHSFHATCIDTWLMESGTCPICRCVMSTGAEIA